MHTSLHDATVAPPKSAAKSTIALPAAATITHKPRDAKRFCLLVMALSGAGLLLLLALNILVDPHNLLGIRLIPPATWPTREFKIKALSEAPQSPQAWILGSSRMMMLAPKELETLTGLSSINMSVDSCRAECIWLLGQIAWRMKREPQTIVLGVDVEAFHNHAPPDQRWLRVPQARNMLPELYEPPVKTFFNDLSQLLSLDMTLDSAVSVKRWIKPPTQPPAVKLEPDGRTRYPLREAKLAAGTFRLEDELKVSQEEYRARFTGFDALSPWRQHYFEQFLRECGERHIRLTVCVTPLHPLIAADLAQRTAYPRLKQELWEYLQKLQSTYGFDLLDFSEIAAFGGNAQDFWDGAHINDANASRLLQQLVARSPLTFSRRSG